MAPRGTNNQHSNDSLLLGNVMDCMCIGLEHSMDLLTCDNTRVRDGGDIDLNQKQPITAVDLATLDYAKLHDEFIESLLQEQQSMNRGQTAMASCCHEIPPLIRTHSSDSTLSKPGPPLDPPIGVIKTSTPRKRRVVKLSRRSPRRSSRTNQVVPTPMVHVPFNPAVTIESSKSIMDDTFSITSDASMITHFTNRVLAKPESYLHDHCKLQKDKNKGESIGSEVCADGKDACLEKIRHKMELLAQIARGKPDPASSADSHKKSKYSASMKRLKAKTSEETHQYVETRSVIDMRMGFLSMKYGILLRWDITETGKIVFVVLRKMCADSFYKKEFVRERVSIPENTVAPFDWTDNHAIWAHRDATEVSLLDPPYLVAPAKEMRPVLLSINILRLEKFDSYSVWTLLFAIKGEIQNVTYRPSQKDKSQLLSWELPAKSVEVDLEVCVIEQKRGRSKRQRSQQFFPLHLLTGGDTLKTTMLTPCGSLHLEIRQKSDYCQWLRSELEARGRLPDLAISRSMTFPKVVPDDTESVSWNCCGVW